MTTRTMTTRTTAATTAPDAITSATARGLSDPRPLAESLARCVVEILSGTRDLDQISRWLSADVYAHLLKRVVLSARARQVRGEAPSRLTFTMGTTVLCEPHDGIVEAVVIVHGRARSRAVAIRLEALDARWRASAVHVL
ncbi:Rv3235 family protein [Herbiconiux sp. P17]|uniref:Rv3235 family protein n=1 Tax=Herbiconiux wuyangfengii TaxID=3342794 RepID=UPI0035BA8E0C